MKGITICADCAYYSLKKHKCTRGCTDNSDPKAPFFADCPLPDVKPVVSAEWIECEDSWFDTYFQCSNCKDEFCVIEGDMYYKICPSCGAEMKGTKKEGD